LAGGFQQQAQEHHLDIRDHRVQIPRQKEPGKEGE